MSDNRNKVDALRAISFECEKCGHIQFGDYTLDHSWHDDRAVMSDNIYCEKCNHENYVVEEL